MSDFLHYMLQKAEKNSAYNAYNHASCALELAQIKERLAEIKSQHEPLSKMVEGLGLSEADALEMRERIYKSAFYVVVGRMI